MKFLLNNTLHANTLAESCDKYPYWRVLEMYVKVMYLYM